jgi:hypothetical protein
MSKFPYQFFNNFVVRTPILSIATFQEFFLKESFDDNKIKKIFDNHIFKEAIYLASPDLFRQLSKWNSLEKRFSENEKLRLKNTFLKYFSRMSSRCTPFGLFAGVGLGIFENQNSASGNKSTLKIRDTKLDMHFLDALSQHLLTINDVKKHILFFPNNSIYKIGEKIRYLEYESKAGKREYIISSAPFSKELKTILTFCKNGKTIDQLASSIINEDFSHDDVLEYIEELIDNQVLISELEPSVVGDDFLDILLLILERIGATNEKQLLLLIKNKILALDSHFGNSHLVYSEIEEEVKKLNVNYEQNHLFQADLYFDQLTELPYFWKKELKRGISILNKITEVNENSYLNKFKKAFYERFENEEIQLTFALDTEVGIGYRQDMRTTGIHPYIEDIFIPPAKEKQKFEIKLNTFQIRLNQKLQEALLEQQILIKFMDEDFKDFEENWEDLPETMSFMTEIISEDGQEKLYLNHGSAIAGKLLGRFCSEKSDIWKFAKDISLKEKELNPNKILAEIVHLPESRIGNILRRPAIRDFEIPYLGNSILPTENQITLDDLYLSMKGNQLILNSKRLNKEIVPCLTNAHNYSTNSLPAYHFLCDFTTQDIRPNLLFQWGDLFHIYNFFPRVEYRNIILSKAKWKISLEEIIHFVSLFDNIEKLMKEIRLWREKRQIPKWVQWIKSDNTLLINLDNKDLLIMFLSSIKNNKMALIEEFLDHKNNDFTNQFIFSMYKNPLS